MVDETVIDPPAAEGFEKVGRDWAKYWRQRIAAGVLGLLLLLAAIPVFLDSPVGHRFLTNSLASYAPASGLRVQVGRIEGSVLDKATLHDVVLYDPKGEFLRVPVVELEWRPLHWFLAGLDVRRLVTRRGHLFRLPELEPGDPEAPFLPDFDIRVDRLEIDSLLIDEAVAGIDRRADILASVRLTDRVQRIRLFTDLGGKDRLYANLHVSKADDRFDLGVDYNAPAGGLLAGMMGVDEDVRATALGNGKWTKWRGAALVTMGEERLAAFRLTKRKDIFGLIGQAHLRRFLSGTGALAVGPDLGVIASATLTDSVLAGKYRFIGSGVRARAEGAIDLADNAFDAFSMVAVLVDPSLFGTGVRAEGLAMRLDLDGPFRDLEADYIVKARGLASGSARLDGLVATGAATWDGERFDLPLDVRARSLKTGSAMIDPLLTGARLRGNVAYAQGQVISNDLHFEAIGVSARLALMGDTNRGIYGLAGPLEVDGVVLDGVGVAGGRAGITAVLGGPRGWSLDAKVNGRVNSVTNATLANLAGPAIGFTADIGMAGNAPILFRDARVDAPKLKLAVSGDRSVDGTVHLAGAGEHTQYGPFTVDTTIDGAGPHAELVLASPLPAAGLINVRIALEPTEEGFQIDAKGGSRLGPFAGTAYLLSPPREPTQIRIADLIVSRTVVSGTLALADGGVTGNLALSGGGVEGEVALAPDPAGQGIAAELILRDAQFDGPVPIGVRRARLKLTGAIGEGTTIEGAVNAQGITYGTMMIGRLAAEGRLRDGTGNFSARVAGRRGTRFALRVVGDVTPGRIAVGVRGRYGGQRVSMPRRAVLNRIDGGWLLERSQIDFAGGRIQTEGSFGMATDFTLRLAGMPLSTIDLLYGDLGLGGTVSGVVEFRDTRDALATGNARLKFDDLTRSGLVLTSRPVDVALVAELGPDAFETRAVFLDDGNRNGRLQARIANLPQRGSLLERLRSGSLLAQVRYDGSADALWRLAAIEVFDLTGPVIVAGDVRGTLDAPVVRGALRAESLRMQSTLTGTDVRGISARGTFDGAVLRITRFGGKAANGGTVSGSGTIDLSDVATNGVGLDIRIAARDALLLDRDDMGATVTGPLRIVAADNAGTIAGRLDMVSGRWRLGSAAVDQSLPNIRMHEINVPPDRQIRTVRSNPWRYLIDVHAKNRFAVTGLGLDSEWGTDIRLRGSTAEPRILGDANLVRGGYEFAGKRFELLRGRIRFSGESPPNPRLDIVAESDVNDIQARIAIAGTADAPQITFNSVPAMPEEEVLSRILFGESIANISAPEALQLGAALTSLRSGGGGLDPINELRGAVGLDRLRVVGADEALGRGTSVAVGKYLGRAFYAELITDGQGYSATELEYRVTRWLSLLATVSSLGYNTLEAKISKDY